MKTIFQDITGETGSVMAIALMVIVTLTIVGLTAMNDTIIENAVARNYRLHRQALVQAEAAAQEAVQIMEDLANPAVLLAPGTPPGSGGSPVWLYPESYNLPGGNTGDFRGDAGAAAGGDYTLSALTNVPFGGYLVIYEGIAPGSSLDMTDPTNLYAFAVFGRGVANMPRDNTAATVQVGYRLRF